jgi:DNA-binding CsgD family transcriptional regulator
MAHAREAVAVAERVGDPEVLVYAHNALAAAIGMGDDAEGALAHSLANLARIGPDISAERALTAYNGVAVGLMNLGRYAEVPVVAERGVELARRSGLGGSRGAWMAWYWVQSLWILGRWAEAEAVVAELDDLLDHPSERGQLATGWGPALILQGRLEEARPLIEQARVEMSRHAWTEDRALLIAAVVMFDTAEGQGTEAEALVNETFERDTGSLYDQGHVVAVTISALADWALAGSTGRHDGAVERAHATATRWIERLGPIERAGRRPTLEQRLQHERALAQVARLQGQSDAQQWARLAASWEGLGFRYDEASARFHRAEALLAGAAGRTASARHAASAELGAACAIAHELNAAPLLRDIATLAKRARLPLDANDAAGRPLDDDTPGDRFGLTPRELDVLALLASGRSNGEIGTELFISTKTASVHVSNILRKLGVANRVEAAAFAADRATAP